MSAAEQLRAPERARRGRMICAVSGKGGVGKTNLVCNVAVAAARAGARVLLVDGDLGLANLDVLLGLVPERSIEDVIAGRCSLEDALTPGPAGVALLPAASGRRELASLSGSPLAAVVALLRDCCAEFDLVAVDAGAGVGHVAIELGAAADPALLVTTPEPTALVDAYATLKVLWARNPTLPIELVVNGARDVTQADAVASQLERLGDRFLSGRPRWRTWIPRDRRVEQAVARQCAVVERYPSAPIATRFRALADRYVGPNAGEPIQ